MNKLIIVLFLLLNLLFGKVSYVSSTTNGTNMFRGMLSNNSDIILIFVNDKMEFLTNISNVIITGDPTGQVLVYDGTNWTNATQSSGGSGSSLGIQDLTNVTITSASAYDVISYSGTDWTNRNVSNYLLGTFYIMFDNTSDETPGRNKPVGGSGSYGACGAIPVDAMFIKSFKLLAMNDGAQSTGDKVWTIDAKYGGHNANANIGDNVVSSAKVTNTITANNNSDLDIVDVDMTSIFSGLQGGDHFLIDITNPSGFAMNWIGIEVVYYYKP